MLKILVTALVLTLGAAPAAAAGLLEESVDFMRRIEAFLARHNPARAPAAAPGTSADGGVFISPSSG